MVVLTLADGTQIKDLELNGTCLVSQDPVDASVFEDNLGRISIDGDDYHEVILNAAYNGQIPGPDGWYFSFSPIPEQELVNEMLISKLDYLAMMSDIDLEEL